MRCYTCHWSHVHYKYKVRRLEGSYAAGSHRCRCCRRRRRRVDVIGRNGADVTSLRTPPDFPPRRTPWRRSPRRSLCNVLTPPSPACGGMPGSRSRSGSRGGDDDAGWAPWRPSWGSQLRFLAGTVVQESATEAGFSSNDLATRRRRPYDT